MIDFWNKRYAETDYAYGEEPNEFFKQEIKKLKTGKLLLPAEGEGRNAVFAARIGWEVIAFDSSIEAKRKAEKLAATHKVKINYTVSDFENFTVEKNSFDCVAFSFAHMPPELRTRMHQNAVEWLKPGGKVILQAFAKEQINEKSGGPGNSALLFSENELQTDFASLSFIGVSTEEIVLSEGRYHQGKAQVVNLVGTK